MSESLPRYQSHGAQADIDLGALRHNLTRVKHLAGKSKILAVIKANGYGHGILRVAQALQDADAFGVACIDEAVALRDNGIDKDIVLLQGITELSEIDKVIQHSLSLVIHHVSQIDLLEKSDLNSPVTVWIKLDTGMHRLGFLPADREAVCTRMQSVLPDGSSIHLMSHLANADDRRDSYTRHQLESFSTCVSDTGYACSMANSAGILGWEQSHYDWVRPGIMLYGVSPFIKGRAADEDLREVMTLRSRLVAVNRMSKGDAIGYGSTWACPEDMNIGVVAIGYGDGYPRHAMNGTPVLLNDKRAMLIGRVSMDMICIDLRQHTEAKVGDTVTLWGKDLPVEEIAECASTIAYELLCGVTSRVRFVEYG